MVGPNDWNHTTDVSYSTANVQSTLAEVSVPGGARSDPSESPGWHPDRRRLQAQSIS